MGGYDQTRQAFEMLDHLCRDKRLKAIETLLKSPLEAGLRKQLRDEYILMTEPRKDDEALYATRP